MSLVYRGSVKDIYDRGESYEFIYSDRYSIFDWGEMPDAIPEKGKCLANFATLFFEHLGQLGYKTHFIRAAEVNSILVKKFKVIRPEWNGLSYNYSAYSARPTQSLVPLEVIFRFKLGQGNSLEARVKKNPEYLQDLGFGSLSEVYQSLEGSSAEPLVEVSTKLESRDRYLTSSEVADMKILSASEKANLYALAKKIAGELKTTFAKINCELMDGKFEFAFGDINSKTGDRDLILVDSIGPDELRLVYEGQPLSKEFLRQIYTGAEWAKALAESKKIAQERKTPDWKKICLEELKMTPKPLKAEELRCASELYLALTQELSGVICKKPLTLTHKTLKDWSAEAKNILRNYL